jgi:DNA-directed RNA polymerase subunit D
MTKIIQKDKEKLIFASKMSDSLANAIRRSVSEIPVLAIDDVELYKNDSALYDEIIAHRLGLIPLVTEKDMNFKEDCTCDGKGCAKCSVQLKLQAKGPGMVYSKELKGKAEVVYPNIPITLLREDQEIELVATAILGKATKHAKFSPGLVYYRNLAEIEIKNCNACKECVEACPLGLIFVEGKKAEIKDSWKCDLCDACVEACKEKGNDSIKIKPTDEILFFVESFGNMDAKDILIEAVKALKENLKQVDKA